MSLPSALLADRRTAGDPNPADQITVTLGDKTFLAGRRTAAHIQATIAQLAIEHPGAHLHVMQACNHKGYVLSEGTHDFDGVLDFRSEGLDGSLAQWWQAQAFLRRMGWACWLRHTGDWADPDAWHVHAVSIGCPGPVGYYVPAQVDDYYRHALGLKGQHDSGDDLSSFPPDIDSTVFDYPAWLEDNMTEDQIRAIVRDEISKTDVGQLKVDFGGTAKIRLQAAIDRLRKKTGK